MTMRASHETSPENQLLEPPAAIAAAIVVIIRLGVLLAMSTMLWTPVQPQTVTALTALPNPLSTCSGSQGFSSSFSAMQKLYLAGCPRVALSRTPGTAPPMLERISLIALPIVALARQPCP